MGDTYLVEIRLARTRWRIKETTRAIAQWFGAEPYREHHPHITLYGPFTLTDPCLEKNLLDAVAACAPQTGAVPFLLGDWECREGMHGGVVAFSIHQSAVLAHLVATLARDLSGFTISLNPWDLQPDRKWFHATIANRLPPEKFRVVRNRLAALPSQSPQQSSSGRITTVFLSVCRVLSALLRVSEGQIRPILLDDAGLRITVMKNTEILGEYDLVMQRWLTQEEIQADCTWQESMARYRRASGFELTGPVCHDPGRVFLISDLHLGHANIIRYCSRPFVRTDVVEMDRVLIDNWNYTVSPNDRVYFLGDLRYGNDAPPAAEYRGLLNGDITFVGGNHDRMKGTVPSARITCNDMEFLLVHNPADIKAGYGGWVIHGHHHNNDLRAFPFMDPISKRINISAEVVGYRPISLQEICYTLTTRVIPSGKPLLLRYPYIPLDKPDISGR